MEQINWSMANAWMAGQLRADTIWVIAFLGLALFCLHFSRRLIRYSVEKSEEPRKDAYDLGESAVISGVGGVILFIAAVVFFILATYNLTDIAANWGASGHLIEAKWYDPKRG